MYNNTSQSFRSAFDIVQKESCAKVSVHRVKAACFYSIETAEIG